MEYYIDIMVQEFPEELNGKGKALQNDSLLEVNTKSLTLDVEKAKLLHCFIVKGVFLAKRARLDIEPGFVFLSM